MTWEEIVETFEKYKNLNNTQIAEKIGKSRSWVSRARKFIDASAAEKKELVSQQPTYKKLYELWEEYKKQSELCQTEENEEMNTDTEEICQNLLKKTVLELKTCEELKKDLVKENAETALDLNRLFNEKNKLEKELILTKKKVKYYKVLYYISIIFSFVALFIIKIKCS